MKLTGHTRRRELNEAEKDEGRERETANAGGVRVELRVRQHGYELGFVLLSI